MALSFNLEDDLHAMKVQMFHFKKKLLKWQLSYLTSDR